MGAEEDDGSQIGGIGAEEVVCFNPGQSVIGEEDIGNIGNGAQNVDARLKFCVKRLRCCKQKNPGKTDMCGNGWGGGTFRPFR